jgi:hypothetical protein
MPLPVYSSMPLIEGNGPILDTDGCISNIGYKCNPVTKTASYTCIAADSGTRFNNRGAAGAVTFTLPAVATSAGLEYWFEAAVLAQNFIVTAPAGTLCAYNNNAATSITLSTAGNIAGASVHVFCDGTKWLSGVRIENIGVTITVS